MSQLKPWAPWLAHGTRSRLLSLVWEGLCDFCIKQCLATCRSCPRTGVSWEVQPPLSSTVRKIEVPPLQPAQDQFCGLGSPMPADPGSCFPLCGKGTPGRVVTACTGALHLSGLRCSAWQLRSEEAWARAPSRCFLEVQFLLSPAWVTCSSLSTIVSHSLSIKYENL